MRIDDLTSEHLDQLGDELHEAKLHLVAALEAFNYLERKLAVRRPPLWVRCLAKLGVTVRRKG